MKGMKITDQHLIGYSQVKAKRNLGDPMKWHHLNLPKYWFVCCGFQDVEASLSSSFHDILADLRSCDPEYERNEYNNMEMLDTENWKDIPNLLNMSNSELDAHLDQPSSSF